MIDALMEQKDIYVRIAEALERLAEKLKAGAVRHQSLVLVV